MLKRRRASCRPDWQELWGRKTTYRIKSDKSTLKSIQTKRKNNGLAKLGKVSTPQIITLLPTLDLCRRALTNALC